MDMRASMNELLPDDVIITEQLFYLRGELMGDRGVNFGGIGRGGDPGLPGAARRLDGQSRQSIGLLGSSRLQIIQVWYDLHRLAILPHRASLSIVAATDQSYIDLSGQAEAYPTDKLKLILQGRRARFSLLGQAEAYPTDKLKHILLTS